MRGTPEAYAKITPDVDTLYFISEVGGTEGVLYLGNKVIGGSSSIDFNNFSIDALKDVLITEGLTDKSLLIYQADSENWTNISFNDLLFVGATQNSSGIGGLVPPPSLGQTKLFLRSDGKWIAMSDDELRAQVQVISGQVQSNQTAINALSSSIDTKIAAAIASLLTLKKVDSVDNIDVSATDASKYLYMVPNGDIYDEYVVINGQLEKIGDTSVNLDGYATVTWVNEAISGLVSTNTFNATIGALSNQLDNLETSNTSINQELEAVKGLISGLQNKDTEIVTNIDSLDKQIKQLQSADVTLDLRLDTIEDIIKDSIIWKELN